MLDRFPQAAFGADGLCIQDAGRRVRDLGHRDGHVHRADVRLGKDNSTRVTVLSGLRLDDLVNLRIIRARLLSREARYNTGSCRSRPFTFNEDS